MRSSSSSNRHTASLQSGQRQRRTNVFLEEQPTAQSDTTTIGALHPGNYSTAKQAVSYIATAFSGTLSLLGSLLVVYYIFTSRNHHSHQDKRRQKRKKKKAKPQEQQDEQHASQHKENTHHNHQRVHPKIPTAIRLVFVWALVNVVTSTVTILRDGFVPADFPDFWWNTVFHNSLTACRFQAFWQHIQVMANALYSTALAGFFFWTMVLGRSFSPKMMWWSHGLALGFPLLTGTIALVLPDNVFNPSVTMACYFADAPLGCHDSNNVVVGDDSCQGSSAYVWAWILTLSPLLICVVAQTVVTIQLGLYIRHLHQVIIEMARKVQNRHYQKKTSSFEVDLSESHNNDFSERSHKSQSNQNDHHHHNHHQEKMTRMKQFVQIEKEGLWTVVLNLVALTLSNIFLVICLLVDQFQSPHTAAPYALRLFHGVLFPLQGFWNCLIFLRPRIVHYRKQHAEIVQRKFELEQQEQQSRPHGEESNGDEEIIREVAPSTAMSYWRATKCVLLHKPHPYLHLLHADPNHQQPSLSNTTSRTTAQEKEAVAAMTPQQKQLNPASYMTSQRRLQPKQPYALGSTAESKRPAWSPNEENQARLLARAMSSRQGLVQATQSDDKNVRRLAQTISTRRLGVNKAENDVNKREGPAVPDRTFARRPPPRNTRVLATMESGKSLHDPNLDDFPRNVGGGNGFLANAGQEAENESRQPQEQPLDDQEAAAISAAAAAVSMQSPDTTLEGNTYHATRRENRASVSSWSKLDTSNHRQISSLQQEKQPRVHRTRGSLNSMSSMESADSFYAGGDGDASREFSVPQNVGGDMSSEFGSDNIPLTTFARNSSVDSVDTIGTLDKDNINNEMGQNDAGRRASISGEGNHPPEYSTTTTSSNEPESPLGKILAGQRLSGWSNFSNEDLTISLDSANERGITTKESQANGNLQASAALMGQRHGDQEDSQEKEEENRAMPSREETTLYSDVGGLRTGNPNHLASVIEGDFEDSKDFSNNSSLDVFVEESGVPPTRKFDLKQESNLAYEEEAPSRQDAGMSNWAVMSATDMLNQPAPDMLAMLAPRPHQSASTLAARPQDQNLLGPSSSHSEISSEPGAGDHMSRRSNDESINGSDHMKGSLRGSSSKMKTSMKSSISSRHESVTSNGSKPSITSWGLLGDSDRGSSEELFASHEALRTPNESTHVPSNSSSPRT